MSGERERERERGRETERQREGWEETSYSTDTNMPLQLLSNRVGMFRTLFLPPNLVFKTINYAWRDSITCHVLTGLVREKCSLTL